MIFLSEAFTRPKVMKSLAKAGFTQSYTYFTWRNFKQELAEYFTELTQSEVSEYLRGNLFPTPTTSCPSSCRRAAGRRSRCALALAATLSSVYGIYCGYELCENTPVPGKEEYLNSEKYEYKVWDWDRPGNIIDYITRINPIRREHPALQEYDNLRFYSGDDENIICYGKATPDRLGHRARRRQSRPLQRPRDASSTSRSIEFGHRSRTSSTGSPTSSPARPTSGPAAPSGRGSIPTMNRPGSTRSSGSPTSRTSNRVSSACGQAASNLAP